MKIKEASQETAVKMNTRSPKKIDPRMIDWWNAPSKKDLAEQILSTAGFLKTNQLYRHRQAALYSRLYGNMPMLGNIGTNLSKVALGMQLPIDRPTMNVVQSCLDTLVSRITQQKPRPVFLTDNANYKSRNLAKQLNQFISGEFHQTSAYKVGSSNLVDSGVLGTGCVQIYEDVFNKRVALDRVLSTELYVDPNDAMYGSPRQLHRLKLLDRSVATEMFQKVSKKVENADQAYPEAGGESSQTISDQIMVVESWHLPSGKKGGDGIHTIVCSDGVLFDEAYEKEKFPFTFLHYNPRLLGFWGQPLTEQLMGTQLEINKLLMTISKSINLVGVPRVFVEESSKVMSAAFNNELGAIVKYRGIMPTIVDGTSGLTGDIYAQLQRLVEYAYQQSGISTLSAQAQKPAGLNSGQALREYDDLQTDRFAALVRRYDDYYIELAYQMIDKARDIALRDGSYQTIYPDKDGTREIDLPDAKLLDDPFVIQCYDTSSLPRDPAGRKEYVVEMMQAGIYTPEEGRRLLGFADTEQEDKLAIASEEWILKVLDEIVEKGKFTPPDPQMNLQLAHTKCIQYYNLYMSAGLEESKAQLLRNFKTQTEALLSAGMPPPPQAAPGAQPLGVPNPPQASALLPIKPQ